VSLCEGRLAFSLFYSISNFVFKGYDFVLLITLPAKLRKKVDFPKESGKKSQKILLAQILQENQQKNRTNK